MLNKIAPKEVQVTGAEDIRMGKEQRRVYGVLQMYHDRRPLLMWSLESPDAVGTARHEAVHFLRQYGYLSEKEWAVLEKHVKDTEEIEKHGIESRYPKADEALKIEEAIAEEFRTWQRKPEAEHPLAKVFEKIKEILENIKSTFREALGREPTVDDIFGDIERGRVGGRTLERH
jgi:thermostable 8-oxoguanine DNA glycosylase